MTTGTTTPSPATSDGGPGATLCADLDTLVAAARKNFPDLRGTRAVAGADGSKGFEAKLLPDGATKCRIMTSEPPYPDAYECDLERVHEEPAKAVLERWAPLVAKCPVVAQWKASKLGDSGQEWEMETGDNHELVVRLVAEGNDKSMPRLVVRLNEI